VAFQLESPSFLPQAWEHLSLLQRVLELLVPLAWELQPFALKALVLVPVPLVEELA